MSKKEVLGIALIGLLNLFAYDVGARDYKYVGEIYNSINRKLNPGRKNEERKIKITLAADSALVEETGEKEIFSILENIVNSVSERANKEFGISFEVKNKFVYDAKEHIYGYIRVEEASLKVPKFNNELRLVFTKRPINYHLIIPENKNELPYYTPTLGMAPIDHNICLIYLGENIQELTNTTLHEILHSFGAEHVDDKNSLMYPLTNSEQKIIDSQTLETVVKNKNKKFF